MTHTIRPRRSVLYMPGSNARALEKGRGLPADALILDLEDAVAPDAKAGARVNVSKAVAAGGFGPREVIVRVNSLDTPWGEADLAEVAAAGPDAVLIPKVSEPADLERSAIALARSGAPDRTRLWAMMETPLAMLNALAIARSAVAGRGLLTCFVMGTNDLAKATGALLTPERPAMLAWLSTCVAAARAHGLDIIDGVYNDIKNEDGFRAECRQGRVLGMDGKTLIHPSQIAAANEAFAPGAEEEAAARKILAAFEQPENRGKGVIALDGRMVERLHAEIAARVVALADAIRAMGAGGSP